MTHQPGVYVPLRALFLVVILSETWFILWLPLVFKAWVDAFIISETWSH